MKLFVVVPLLYREWHEFKESILLSLDNIYSTFSEDCFFLLVLQDKKSDKLPTSDAEVLNRFSNHEVLFTDVLNVSNARNLGIKKAKRFGFTHLLFHDASVVLNRNAGIFFKNSENGDFLPKLMVSFQAPMLLSDQKEVDISLKMDVEPKQVNPIRDCYLWSYIFNVNFIDDYFDRNLGPGEDTFYKCGEDVLFLFSYLNSSNINISKSSSSGIVYHPSRPNDFSKHLLYARGQGHLFKILLQNNLKKNRKMILYEFCLFVGNSFFRVLLFRTNSTKIFKLRLKGLFDRA